MEIRKKQTLPHYSSIKTRFMSGREITTEHIQELWGKNWAVCSAVLLSLSLINLYCPIATLIPGNWMMMIRYLSCIRNLNGVTKCHFAEDSMSAGGCSKQQCAVQFHQSAPSSGALCRELCCWGWNLGNLPQAKFGIVFISVWKIRVRGKPNSPVVLRCWSFSHKPQ